MEVKEEQRLTITASSLTKINQQDTTTRAHSRRYCARGQII